MKQQRSRFELFALVSMMFLGTNSFSSVSNTLRRSANVGMQCAVQSCCAVRHLHSRNGDFLTMRSDGAKPPPKKNMDARLRGGAVRRSRPISDKSGDASAKTVSPENSGVRLNKCLHELSRRGADDAIAEGRVTINNQPATNGMRVQKRDIVRLVRMHGDYQHFQ